MGSADSFIRFGSVNDEEDEKAGRQEDNEKTTL